MASFQGLSIPAFDPERLSAAQARQIKSYLFQLTEQLKYVMGHLDEENLSESVNLKLEQAADTAGKIEGIQQTFTAANGRLLSRIEDAEGAASELEQLLTGFRLAVDNMKMVLDVDGVTILNGGFRIGADNGTYTFTVDNAGKVTCTNIAIDSSAASTETVISIGDLGIPGGDTGIRITPKKILIISGGGIDVENEEGGHGIALVSDEYGTAGSAMRGAVLRLNDGQVELGGGSQQLDSGDLDYFQGRVKCNRLMVNGHYYIDGNINGTPCLVRAD